MKILSKTAHSVDENPFAAIPGEASTFTTYRYEVEVDGQTVPVTTCLDPESSEFQREARALAIQHRALAATPEERVLLAQQLDDVLGYHGILWTGCDDPDCPACPDAGQTHPNLNQGGIGALGA